jgi:hypothetical protein
VGTEIKAWVSPLEELLTEMKGEVGRVSAKGWQHLFALRVEELSARYEGAER